jgi:hypothetical protein
VVVFDGRLRHVDWRVTSGVASVLPVSFVDEAGDPYPVDTWTFAANAYTAPGGSATALTVGTALASAGSITVSIGTAVAASWTTRVWALIWTRVGEAGGGIGGRLVVDPVGARGAASGQTVGVEVVVT